MTTPPDTETVHDPETEGCAIMALILAVFILALLFGTWLIF